MIEMIESDQSDEEYVRMKYSRANRFAWIFVVGLAFAGNIIARALLHDTIASLLLGALCIAGIVAREIYLNCVFRGVPPENDGGRPKPLWIGITVRAVVITLIWLIPDISEGRVTGMSLIFAGAVGAGSAILLWWQESHAAADSEMM